MKRLTVLSGLAAATALAGCSSVTPVTPVETYIAAPTSVLSTVTSTPTTTTTVVPLSHKPAHMVHPSYAHVVPTTSGYHGYQTMVAAPAVQQYVAPQPVTQTQTVTSTPMAVHAGVPTPYGVSNAVQYDGYNGVRPFLVQSGAVWNGPSTYMLPIGATPGSHQHVETVSADYASVGSTIVHTANETPGHGHRHAQASTKLSIRKGPSRNDKTCAVIPAGKKASVFDCNNGWCRVTYKGTSGYARQTYLNFVD